MNKRSIIGLASAAMIVATVGIAGSANAGSSDAGGEQRYEATMTVLQDSDGGPQLCPETTASLPPQCDGADVEGWDWNTVHHDSMNGTRWGSYRVVGTWADDGRFTLTEPATEAQPRPRPEPDLAGWSTGHRMRALEAFQRDLHDRFDQITLSTIDNERRIIVADTFAETPQLRKQIDRRYGEGVVYLHPHLRAVGDEAAEPPQEYTFTGTVLANADHGPQMCQMVAMSYPPRCGGPDVHDWDWSTVDHQSESGVRWGEYTITGTWDGEAFTVTKPATEPKDDGRTEPQLDGWSTTYSEKELERVQQQVQEEFDVEGAYVDKDHRVVVAQVWAASDELRAAVEERFGKGVVYLWETLQPTGGGTSGDPGYSPDRPYRVTTTVLENERHGPQLCAVVAESYPPQCSGPDIAGWSWKGLDKEQANGVRWGQYTMVGTWDGEKFTLTEKPRPPQDQEWEEPDLSGWQTDKSYEELQDVQRRLHEKFDLIYSSTIDEEHRVVVADTYLETPELRKAVDREAGEGVVYLTSMLKPAE